MIQKHLLTRDNLIMLMAFMLGLLLPLKEDYSSKALIVLAVLVLIHFYKNGIKLRESYLNLLKIQKAIFILAVLILVYAILTILLCGVKAGFDINRLSFSLLLLSFSLFFVLLKNVNFRVFVYALLLGLSISGVLRVIFGFFDSHEFIFQRVKIPYENYISSSPLVYSVMLNFCYSYFLSNYQKMKRVIFLLVITLVLFFHITFFTVSGFSIFLLVNFIFIIFIFFKKFYKPFVILLFISSFVIFSFLLTEKGSILLKNVEGESSRVRNYSTSLIIIKKSPLIGYGVGNELYTLQENRNPKVWEFKEKYHAHNQYFEFIIGGGVINLVLYLTLFALSFLHALKNNKILLLLFLVNILFTMYIESLLVIHKGFIFVTLIFGYLIFFNDNNREDL